MRAILTYHSLDGSGSPISVAPEAFGRHVAWLVSGRVRVVDLAELQALPPEADAVALTFDDAFQNFVAVAAPLLRAHRLPATVYVVPGHVGGTNAWGGVSDPRVPTLPLADWDALGRLVEAGVRLGAHTRSHPHLTRVPPAQLADELVGAQEAIRQATGQRPDCIAYPYGDVDATVAARAAATYRLGVTTELRAMGAREDPLRLPRLDMYYLRDPGRLEAWGSTAFAGRLWLRAQARRLRATLDSAGGGW
ncbi:MAG: polysaccharide deacetylase family protein [Gemmatimonadetes bacterium]|nr:polysaccharide deacetylase family protein [Gemmatimonadota bacterium]MBK7349699.1 polysaccharide deacetylase family protein [Gemmatimonadota bacterium]MBK7784330.1 polysaccharide deacetylase family protein [Gemmatimonadota bacterium]MBK7925262.1 polysaccharide deacetylase family protein [Gemmatimonadota bacterium]